MVISLASSPGNKRDKQNCNSRYGNTQNILQTLTVCSLAAMKLTAPFLLPIIFQLLLIDDSNANLLEKSLLDDSQSDRLLADCPYQYQYFYKTFITMIDSYENNPISCSASQIDGNWCGNQQVL